MAVDTSQLLADAQCVVACIPLGLMEAAQLAASVGLSQATVVTVTAFTVSTNGVQLLAVNPKRRLAIVENTGGITLAFVGPSTVTTSGSTIGLTVAQFPNFDHSRFYFYSTSDLYAASTGTGMRVLEFSVP